MKRGFTLIEMIVAIGILAILSAVLIATLDPIGQLEKANDATRHQALTSLKVALEEYVNDQKCYPQTLTFGSSLTKNGKTYMAVPQDPKCGSGGWCYSYQTDGSACPQWYVIYYALEKSTYNLSEQCPLVAQQTCTPPNFLYSHYNACITSEDYDCSYISQHDFQQLQ